MFKNWGQLSSLTQALDKNILSDLQCLSKKIKIKTFDNKVFILDFHPSSHQK